MKITEEHLKQFKQFIEPKMPATCKICGGNGSFAICKGGMLINFDKVDEIKGSEAMPLIAVVCNNCGHVEFFNPITIGIIKP